MIFLGLASNYKFSQALRQLFTIGGKKDSARLRRELAEYCGIAPQTEQTSAQKTTNPERDSTQKLSLPADPSSSQSPKSSNDQPEDSRVFLYHTGRSALAAGFMSVLPAGGPVIIPGLTCIAVVRAVRAAGCEPVYVDIERETLQYDWNNLEMVLEKLSKTTQKSSEDSEKHENHRFSGCVLAQNTLGLPLDIERLERLAGKYNFAIVEDLAHSAGRVYPDGRKIGSVGAVTAFSFGKGKAIDTIEGGALVIRSLVPKRKDVETSVHEEFDQKSSSVSSQTSDVLASEQSSVSDASISGTLSDSVSTSASRQSRISNDSSIQPNSDSVSSDLTSPTRRPSLSDRLRDRWYPLFGWVIRAGYHIGLGKVFTGILLKLHWIARSADAKLNLDVRLTHWQAKLASRQLKNLPETPLRGHDFVEHREELLAELKKKGYYLDEIWYDTPVAPERYSNEAVFPADRCPHTIEIAKVIINYPSWYSEKKLAPVREIIEEWKENHVK